MDERLDGGVVRTSRLAERAAAKRARVRVAAIRRMANTLILRAFRTYLHSTVRFASPVLLVALQREGIPLEVAAGRLRPPWGWPEPIVLTHTMRHSVADKYSAPGGRRRASSGWKRRALPTGDGAGLFRATLRAAAHPDGLLEIGVHEGGLELMMTLRECTLTSWRGLGFLKVLVPLPDTLADGFIGRPVEQVVDHPLLRGPGVDRRPGGLDPGRCRLVDTCLRYGPGARRDAVGTVMCRCQRGPPNGGFRKSERTVR